MIIIHTMMIYCFIEFLGDKMKYTVGELIKSLSHFDEDMEIENNLVLTWHHDYKDSKSYESVDDLPEECFTTCDKIWIFEERSFEDHLDWHRTVVDDGNE